MARRRIAGRDDDTTRMTYSNPEASEGFMRRWSARLAPLFVRFPGVEDGLRILDVGCGTGVLARAALAVEKTSKATGVDPVENFISFARLAANDPRAEFQVASVEALPFPDGAFDATLGLLVLQEFDDPESIDQGDGTGRAAVRGSRGLSVGLPRWNAYDDDLLGGGDRAGAGKSRRAPSWC